MLLTPPKHLLIMFTITKAKEGTTMTMTRYFIRTWTEEGTMVCEYGHDQWVEVIKSLKENNREFKAWKEHL